MGEGATLACFRMMGAGGANSDDWRESLALCILCEPSYPWIKDVLVGIQAVHGNARFTCPEPNCDVTAKNKDHIKDHIAAIHRKEPRYTDHSFC